MKPHIATLRGAEPACRPALESPLLRGHGRQPFRCVGCLLPAGAGAVACVWRPRARFNVCPAQRGCAIAAVASGACDGAKFSGRFADRCQCSAHCVSACGRQQD